jgi:hypothetical protein
MMNWKLSLACAAAFAALAFPTTASANDPQLTNSKGELVAVGTTDIQLTQVGSTGILDTSGNRLVQCTSGTGLGSIVNNSGGTVEGQITSLTIGGTGPKSASEPGNECTSSFGNFSITPILPWCLRSGPGMSNDEMQVRGGKCTEAATSVKFIMASTTIGECEYSRAAAVPVQFDFTTTPEDARATIRSTPAGSGLSRIRGGIFCPSSVMMEGTRTAEDEAGNPFFVS